MNGIRTHEAELSTVSPRPTDPPTPWSPPSASAQPFVSAQAKVYLVDVLDHIDSVLASLELFSGIADNLGALLLWVNDCD